MLAADLPTVHHRDRVEEVDERRVSCSERGDYVRLSMVLKAGEEVSEDVLLARAVASVDGDVVLHAEGIDDP